MQANHLRNKGGGGGNGTNAELQKWQGADLQAPVPQTAQSGRHWGAGTQGAPVSLLLLGPGGTGDWKDFCCVFVETMAWLVLILGDSERSMNSFTYEGPLRGGLWLYVNKSQGQGCGLKTYCCVWR